MPLEAAEVVPGEPVAGDRGAEPAAPQAAADLVGALLVPHAQHVAGRGNPPHRAGGAVGGERGNLGDRPGQAVIVAERAQQAAHQRARQQQQPAVGKLFQGRLVDRQKVAPAIQMPADDVPLAAAPGAVVAVPEVAVGHLQLRVVGMPLVRRLDAVHRAQRRLALLRTAPQQPAHGEQQAPAGEPAQRILERRPLVVAVVDELILRPGVAPVRRGAVEQVQPLLVAAHRIGLAPHHAHPASVQLHHPERPAVGAEPAERAPLIPGGGRGQLHRRQALDGAAAVATEAARAGHRDDTEMPVRTAEPVGHAAQWTDELLAAAGAAAEQH